MKRSNSSYSESGVNIDEGNRFVSLIKDSAKSTMTKGVVGGIGGFAGLFSLSAFKSMDDPILVSGTDGVGTKLKIAIDTGIYDSVGIDLVAMCVNDILVIGAKPLFFLDYIATSKLYPEKMRYVVEGIAKGCIESEIALLGGETAEMPGMYHGNDFDLAGFAVGIIDKKNIIDGTKISAGDRVVGVASSGFHSNGYSLVRKALLDDLALSVADREFTKGKTLGESLLTPTKIYVKLVNKLIDDRVPLHGMVHVTGGGFYENIPRTLPQGVSANIYPDKIRLPEVYNKFLAITNIDKKELYRVFNMGIGYIIITDKISSEKILSISKEMGYDASDIGEIIEGNQSVNIEGIDF